MDIEKEFRKKHKRFTKTMTRMLRGDTGAAEDVVQEAFLKAWMFKDSYNPKKGSPSAWLNGILFNCFRTYIRSRQMEVPISEHIDPDTVIELVEEEDLRWDKELLLNKIKRIKNKKHQQVVILHFLLGYSTKDIGSMNIGVTDSSARVIVHRMKEKL